VVYQLRLVLFSWGSATVYVLQLLLVPAVLCRYIIPEEDQNLIFDAFYRSQNVGSRRGMGLGLSIVYDELQQLNAAITVTSQKGKGTTMRVEIPIIDSI
jgi:chemotaxis protein histidine kinase CheA